MNVSSGAPFALEQDQIGLNMSGWIFGKVPKGEGGGGGFNPKVHIVDLGPLNRAF